MPGGRPPDYKTPEELEEKANQYFKEIEENKKRPTTSGLAYHLGFASRQSIWDYGCKEEFSYVIKRCLLRITEWLETNSTESGKTAGCIFGLMNMKDGWENKQNHDLTSGGKEIVPIVQIARSTD